MKSKAIICAIAAFSVGFSGLALAQQDKDVRAAEAARHNMARDNNHGHDRGPGPDRRADVRHDGRGAGPDHNFYRGGRLPTQYRSHQYVVDDWRGHHLTAPPRGYHWVQTGGDYVLVAVATGIIASILLNQ
jgi:Ni/Co efflux regulator RcnB